MDVRFTLPIMLLVVAVALAGAVDTTLRAQDDGFQLLATGPAAGGVALVAMVGPHGASPPLSWTDPPAGTVQFALVAEDLDREPAQRLLWLMDGIAPASRAIAGGQPGWSPPSYSDLIHHRLRVTLYALDAPVIAPAGLSRRDFARRVASRSIGHADWLAGGGWSR